MKNITFYIDMDGVLARWSTTATVEDTKKPGYFFNREAELVLIEVVLELVRLGYQVSILSHSYNDRTSTEKADWLEKYGLGHVHRTFVPYGDAKSEYIEQDGVNILLDDFTQNLVKWEDDGNVGVKLYNGINGSNGTWNGLSVHLEMPFEKIISTLIESSKKK